MAHLHSIYDTDLHFIIDPIARRISSESGKVTLMQKDHNSERFTFEVPRYIEGHDMSLTDIVQVHYNNLEAASPKRQNKDIYPVLDLQISPDSDDMVIFSWLISGNATQYVGSLNFIVRFVCYNGEEIVYQWWSDTYTQIKIAATMDNTGEAVDLDDTDILESWRQQCIQAVFESEVFSTLEAQGKSYVNQAKVYAEQAREISGLNTIDDIVEDMRSVMTADISAPGWYRVAEYFAGTSVVGVQGAFGNSCDIFIKTSYRNTPTMVADIALKSRHLNQNFYTLLSGSSTDRCIDKIRYVYDKTAVKAYLEIHYTKTISNAVNIELTRIRDSSNVYLWKTIAPVLTEETVNGITVTATHEIPTNANPLTNMDVAQFSGTDYLGTSVLEKALIVPIGVHQFRLQGDSYAGTDLPSSNYKYGNTTIYKRSDKAVNVILWGASRARSIAKNDYNGETWSGWQTYATIEDLANSLDEWQSKLDTVQTTSSVQSVSAAGWYRIAEYESTTESSANGAAANVCDILIKRGFSNTLSEYHLLRLRATYNSIEIASLDDKSGVQLVTQARHVVDTSTHKSYIEIYYKSDAANGIHCTVMMGKDRLRLWQAITPTLTSETVDGVTVTTTYDIPANASPVTDLDLNALINGTTTVAKATYASTAGSAPASDVYPWAKASTKPSYAKSEVGLGNVDNTADSAKSVKYAADAGNASKLGDNSPSYFATAESVNKIVSGATTVSKATSATTATLDSAGNDIATTIANLIAEIAVERARISQLSSLPYGSTTGDSELMGIRIDVNGVEHDNAGDAVRAQFLVRNVKYVTVKEAPEVSIV